MDNADVFDTLITLALEDTDIVREQIPVFDTCFGTVEDCAKKIQSRVSIWLAEHR